MKTYTTKANANRAAKNLTAKHETIVASAVVVPSGSGYTIEFELNDGFEVSKDFAQFNYEVISSEEPASEPEAGEKPEKHILRKSEVQNPVSLVWDIADKMSGARRKDVIAACVEQGVAFYTARTQYQQWKKANGK